MISNPLTVKIIVLSIYVAILFLIGVVASKRIKNNQRLLCWRKEKWVSGPLHFQQEQQENLVGSLLD